MDRVMKDMASNDLLAASEANMVAFWTAYGSAGVYLAPDPGGGLVLH